MPASAPVPSSTSSTVAWNVDAVAVAERRRPDGDRGAVLDLAARAEHAAGAAADERGRGERLVDRLERRLGRREVRAGGEHDREVARAPARPSRAVAPPRARPRAGRARREAGADADGHAAYRRYSAPMPHRRPSSRSSAPPAWARPRWRSRWPTGCAPTGRTRSPCRPTRCRSTAASRCSPAPRRRRAGAARAPAARRSCPSTRRSAPAQYARLAHAEIDGLLAQGRRPIVVGGTGLYLRAALAELDLRPPARPAIRARCGARARAARRAGAARRARTRARRGGGRDRADRPPARSSARSSCSTPATSRPRAPQLWTDDTRHPTLLVGLTMEREALYARIDARVDAMVAAGAVEEVARRRRGGVGRPRARRSASRSCSRATSRR